VDRIDAELGGEGKQDGNGHDEGWHPLQNGAQEQEEDVDKKEEQVLPAAQVMDEVRQGLRHLFTGEKPPEDRRHSHQDHHLAGDDPGFEDDLQQLLEGDFPVDQHTHNEAVDHGEHRCFRWGTDSPQNPAEDDDRHEEGQ